MSKLKIYACNGVGQTNSLPTITNEGTNALENTQAMNTLLSLINMCAADAGLNSTTPDERKACYQDMDIYSVCFHFARLYKNNNKMLEEAGYAISKFLQDGRFKIDSLSLEEHGQHVDRIIDSVQALIDSGDYPTNGTDFIRWWEENILAHNYAGLTPEKLDQANNSSAMRNIKRKASSADWQQNKDLNTYLNDAGTYFIYTYFTDEEIKRLPAVFAIKRKKQQEVYNYCLKCFTPVYGTEADMKRIISNGIKLKFKESPRDLCVDIVNGRQSVGIATEIIVAIISAIVTILTTVLTLVLNYCAAVAAAKYTVPEDPSAGIATEEDFENWDPNSNKKSVWLWIAGAVAALFLLK